MTSFWTEPRATRMQLLPRTDPASPARTFLMSSCSITVRIVSPTMASSICAARTEAGGTTFATGTTIGSTRTPPRPTASTRAMPGACLIPVPATAVPREDRTSMSSTTTAAMLPMLPRWWLHPSPRRRLFPSLVTWTSTATAMVKMMIFADFARVIATTILIARMDTSVSSEMTMRMSLVATVTPRMVSTTAFLSSTAATKPLLIRS
mmetsp:Transcript_27018/g.63174  ORF Transcript_27018/g.63174 Transcript_27018/m.63174 type:complete len:207 (+) Transcript_27018:896-1516(+)